MGDREVYRSKESMAPPGIGPTHDKVVIVDGDKRYEGYGNSEEEAYRNAREKEEADDDDDD
jgi:hypothetical protein